MIKKCSSTGFIEADRFQCCLSTRTEPKWMKRSSAWRWETSPSLMKDCINVLFSSTTNLKSQRFSSKSQVWQQGWVKCRIEESAHIQFMRVNLNQINQTGIELEFESAWQKEEFNKVQLKEIEPDNRNFQNENTKIITY